MSGALSSTGAPGFVDAILAWRWTGPLARLALVGAYVQGSLVKLLDFPGAVAEQVHFGIQPAVVWAVLTILVELVGAVLVVTGRWLWLGAGMLGIFTGLAALKANAFWAMDGQALFMAMNAFFEHLGLIGGFVLAAMLSRNLGARRV